MYFSFKETISNGRIDREIIKAENFDDLKRKMGYKPFLIHFLNPNHYQNILGSIERPGHIDLSGCEIIGFWTPEKEEPETPPE